MIEIFAPAKINVSLRVVGKRADGYHLLHMVMVPLQFGDQLVIGEAPVACPPARNVWERDGITLATDDDSVPLDDRHLCVRAANAIRVAAGRGSQKIWIHLTKHTPVGAGLGGGSSDAAAVLRGLGQLWQLEWSESQLAEIGVRLGADVPFFCWGRSALVEGIGEQVTPYANFPKLWILLVNPRVHVATAEIFKRYAFHLTPQRPDVRTPPFFATQENVAAILSNDLESVTIPEWPVIDVIKVRLRTAGAIGSLMSGSGPTVFGIFPSRQARDHAATAFAADPWWLCATESSD